MRLLGRVSRGGILGEDGDSRLNNVGPAKRDEVAGGYLRRTELSMTRYDEIVSQVLSAYRTNPVDILGNGNAEKELQYLTSHMGSYVRTIRDLDTLWRTEERHQTILEIGSFLGLVCVCLKRLGYHVHALDIPEFYESAALRSVYEKNNIPYAGLNLREYRLPYDSAVFDAVILCEVLEHLNFNPLPVLQEVNRILKPAGYLYVGMPNQARALNRARLLVGKSIHNPVSDFLRQLNRTDNMIVGLHWREYTIGETVSMIEHMGFRVIRQFFFDERETARGPLRSTLTKLFYLIPPLRPYHVVIGQKESEANQEFWLTEASR
jgi:SAM-dependent methyltransferase